MFPCPVWLRLAEPASISLLDGRVGRGLLGRGFDEPTDKSEARTAQTSGRSKEAWPMGRAAFQPAGWLAARCFPKSPPHVALPSAHGSSSPRHIERFHDDCWNRR
ncbi:hypothetical protein CGRA01v4_01202 [Colletotrichum graminicola]|nr:hypothetical protein CGRA01v4_01202 [Colletotrichum graminicola]